MPCGGFAVTRHHLVTTSECATAAFKRAKAEAVSVFSAQEMQTGKAAAGRQHCKKKITSTMTFDMEKK